MENYGFLQLKFFSFHFISSFLLFIIPSNVIAKIWHRGSVAVSNRARNTSSQMIRLTVNNPKIQPLYLEVKPTALIIPQWIKLSHNYGKYRSSKLNQGVSLLTSQQFAWWVTNKNAGPKQWKQDPGCMKLIFPFNHLYCCIHSMIQTFSGARYVDHNDNTLLYVDPSGAWGRFILTCANSAD